MRKKGHRGDSSDRRRRDGLAGNTPVPIETPRSDIDFPDLVAEYRDVLEWFGTPIDERGDATETLRTRVNDLRVELFKKVHDYTSALVMLGWRFPAPSSEAMWKLIRKGGDSGSSENELDVQSTKDVGSGRKSRLDPWSMLAESDIAEGALWIDLLVSSWDQWDSVPRPETWDDFPDSVWGRLIRLFQSRSEQRRKPRDPSLSVEVQFRNARDAAWSAVVRETLKWRGGSRKPNAVGHSEAQQNRDAFMVDRFLETFRVGRELDRGEQVKTLIEQLARRRARKGVALIKTDPDKVSSRISRIRAEWKEPPCELTAALLWTSADLPLCLMSSAAAAATVFEIRYGPEGKTPEDRPSKETFLNRFRVMTGHLKMPYFLSRRRSGKSPSAPANVVAEISVARAKLSSPDDRPPDADQASCGERLELLQKTLAVVALRDERLEPTLSAFSRLLDAEDWLFDFLSLKEKEKLPSKVAEPIEEFQQRLADLKLGPNSLRGLWGLLRKARLGLEEEIETLKAPQGRADQEAILTLKISESYRQNGIEVIESKIRLVETRGKYGGLEEDEVRAVELSRKAAELGSPDWMARIGDAFFDGHGGFEKDEQRAVEWWRKSAELGRSDGMACLAIAFAYGHGGLEKDERQAVEWLRKSAELGHAGAMAALGIAFFVGWGGLEKDERQAVDWWRKAEAAGYELNEETKALMESVR